MVISPLSSNSDMHLISPYSITTHTRHENKGNDHQLSNVLIFNQILRTSNIRNMRRIVRRKRMSILGLKGLKTHRKSNFSANIRTICSLNMQPIGSHSSQKSEQMCDPLNFHIDWPKPVEMTSCRKCLPSHPGLFFGLVFFKMATKNRSTKKSLSNIPK